MNVIELNGTWTLNTLTNATDLHDIPVTIPGSIISGALENNLINHPYYRNNEDAIQYLFNNHYSFSRTFTLDVDVLNSEQILLNCEGLDTLATIFINHTNVLETDNMFRRYKFDIKPYVELGENTIEIQFYSPIQYLNDIEKQGGNGLANLRKAQCMFGWDWGIKLPDSGIWKSIAIEYGDYMNIPPLLFTQTHHAQTVELNVRSKRGIDEATALTCTLYDPNNQAIESVTINNSRTFQHTFIIEDPRLWWPIGYGEQPLYTVHVELYAGNQSIDHTSHLIGLRTVKLNRDNDGDGSKFEFIINDTPVFIKGTNMIIEDAILTQSRRYNLTAQIKDCVRANINCIRVWGGAYYPSDLFFDLCDQYGILVIQDCMFTSVSYPTDMDFMVNVTMELIQNIERMAHHPSLILLFGNNEIDMTYTMLTSDEPRTAQTREFFEVSKITDENMKQIMQTRYKTLFLETIPDITKRNAPQVPYAHSSPNTKSNHMSKSIFDYAKDGDFHYYLAYDGEAPYESIKQLHARFISEMGFQSYPSMKTIDSFSKSSDQSPNSPVMLAHQKCKNGNQIIENYMQAEFKLPEDFTDYVYLSQILAGIVMRYSVEHFRSENDYCRGVILWQMNDCWPTISWSGVDYYGRWKAQQYFTKRFYASVLPVIHIGHKSVNMTVVNDLIDSFEGLLTWQLKHHNNLLDYGEMPVTVAANHHCQLSELCFNDLEDIPLNELYFEYQLHDNADNVIADGIELFVKPKDFQFEQPDIRYTITEQDHQFIIKVSSTQMTKFIALDLTEDDCIFSDNYFDLSSAHPKYITVDKSSLFTKLNIDDFKKQLTIKTLNETQLQ